MKNNASLLDYLKAWPLYLLPHYLLSALMHRFMRIKVKAIKNAQIKLLAKRFNINISEALITDIDQYETFNAFFTRELKPSVRPISSGDNVIISPVDGAVSEAAPITHGRVLQAKGHDYSLATLLGDQPSLIEEFDEGLFSTLYLSPKDYHRIHMPVAGTLTDMWHVPGRLFSVNNSSVKTIPGLFARNERVIARFDTEHGPMLMILVGAIFVSSIETVWHGEVTPPRRQSIQHWRYDNGATFEQGQEMGRFNMGSTVILLFPKGTAQWDSSLIADSPVQLGQRIGTYR